MKAITVLVVEDEIIIAHDLCRTLQRMGYRTLGPVAAGEDALTLIRRDAPDLVLMDIMLMGAMDGIAAAGIVREEFGIPVVYLTSNSDPATVERAQATRPFSYLLKPVRERELRMSIEMAVLHHATAHQLGCNNEELTAELSRRDADLRDEVLYRVRLERNLRQTQATLQAARASMSRMLDTAREELRTPLADLAAALDELEIGPLDPRERDALRMIGACTSAMRATVRAVFDLLELTSGEVVLARKEFDPRACVQAVVARRREEAHAREAEVAVRIAPEVPAGVRGDPRRFEQLIDALLENAFRNLAGGTIDLHLDLLGRKAGAVGLQIAVRDSGAGLPRARQREILQALTRAADEDGNGFAATDTNLGIAAQLIELMKGSIWLSSELGAGSTFRCAVWLDEPAVAASAPPGAVVLQL